MNKYIRFVFVIAFALVTSALHAAGNLKVNLYPAGAVSAGARWRVDGGAWQLSGSTVKGLYQGNHNVEFASVNGWITPAAQSVAIRNGSTTSATATYTQAASVTVALNPSSGQWRVNGGSWIVSGGIAANLAPGSHLIEYAPLAGHIAPSSETLTLAAGQAANLQRAYTGIADLTVTLNHTAGQWRLDGGVWHSGGTTLSGIPAGSHTIEYASVAYWESPATETVTLAAGQSLQLSREYIRLNQVLIGLVPSTGMWRLDGGAWQPSGTSLWVRPGTYTIDYLPLPEYDAPPAETITSMFAATRYYTSIRPTLKVTLTPSQAQWRVDGGAWQASGATVAELAQGQHAIEYQALAGYQAPPAETVTLALRENAVLTRSYVQLASLIVTLTPATAQWRVDGGAWQPSGATVADLTIGSHSVEYSSVAGYVTPDPKTLSLVSGPNTHTASYAIQPASLTVNLTPSAGQWLAYPAGAAPVGNWNASGATVTGLTPGTYNLAYSVVTGYVAPTLNQVTLAAGEARTLDAAYTPAPADIRVELDQSSGQWRVDSGAWQPAGASLSVNPGEHTLEFASVPGYTSPPPQTITLNSREAITYRFRYTPDGLSSICIHTVPATIQWRIGGSAWQESGATVSDLPQGSYPIEYTSVPGYSLSGPSGVWFVRDERMHLTAVADRQYGGVTMTLSPSNARWRVDGGNWLNTGAAVAFDAGKPHLIEYEPVAGYPTPHSEYVTSSYQFMPLSRTYQATSGATVSVGVDLEHGGWRIYSGSTPPAGWQPHAATVNLPAGTYTIDYKPVTSYGTPTTETITLLDGQDHVLARRYTAFPGRLTVTTTPENALWSVSPEGSQTTGESLSSGQSATLAPGRYVIRYSSVPDYLPAWEDYVTINSAQSIRHHREYEHVYQLKVWADPYRFAKYRVDGGAWLASSTGVWDLALGDHLVEYSDVPGYVTPPSEIVTYSGTPIDLYRPYRQLAFVQVNVDPYRSAQFRINGGEWQASGSTVYNLPFDVPVTIEYSAVEGYTTLPPENVILRSGYNDPIYRSYTALASIQIYVDPYQLAQFRINGGAWQASGNTASNLPVGVPLTLEFSNVDGYITPPAETITLHSGTNDSIYRSYRPLAELTVSIYPPMGRWRVNGGAWQNPDTTARNLPFDTALTVEYEAVAGYQAPPSESLTLYSGEQRTIYRSYTPLP